MTTLDTNLNLLNLLADESRVRLCALLQGES